MVDFVSNSVIGADRVGYKNRTESSRTRNVHFCCLQMISMPIIFKPNMKLPLSYLTCAQSNTKKYK